MEALKGLMRSYRDEFGVAPLLRERKEPMTNQIIADMLRVLADPAAKLGTRKVDPASPYWIALAAIIHVMAQAGFRKNEIAVKSHAKDAWGFHKPSRASLHWHLKGATSAVPSLTREQLTSLREGDVAILVPPPSKADQFGEIWGSKPIFLTFSSTATICAARQLRNMELAQPCEGTDRASTPLFVNAATGRCFTYAELNTLLKHLLLEVLEDAGKLCHFSWHSFRIYLCTALHESGCPDGVIQALLRWRSDKSMLEYRRLTYAKYNSWLQGAGRAEVRTVTAPNLLPVCDPADGLISGIMGLNAGGD